MMPPKRTTAKRKHDSMTEEAASKKLPSQKKSKVPIITTPGAQKNKKSPLKWFASKAISVTAKSKKDEPPTSSVSPPFIGDNAALLADDSIDLPEEVLQQLGFPSYWMRSYLLWDVSSWDDFYAMQVKKTTLIGSHNILKKELNIIERSVKCGKNFTRWILRLRNDLKVSILIF
ncbi:hypothetical protein BC938DRAFT_473608 [Jimgerdemannia flammicorona]|uniref:Uncharacterized protein n=1 Tax=Jimgerdemannia flammicorona TaxID=994334 RepID=A0A433Q3U4_9FUNG|nr:hypothetical protein BC938DRAFT_473608 [Jimgerdemannia flammicorona]